ncbi:AraC family transcriptional regulator [Bacillus sp. EB106-08-02-XG196]|uniref:AraC family transcriptional regulator n=1 Tax=Bacillus sp. EB106-08-02-XG196 TaxID=2737049 RepID=UPI00183CC602|nr:AraC family transcriptional regulator [Bacillus sp. EB106-08-02-XG196]NWQ43409.1 AraC family transcriptional regulator [Bacillus sp. EB106-08-02-XG196]
MKKEFKLVGLKGSGEFVNFGHIVPLLSKQLISRRKEIVNSTETEIALFEPKKDEEHLIGHFYAGLIVNEKINEVPSGMDYIETNKSYVTTRGDISNVGELHLNLLNWAENQVIKEIPILILSRPIILSVMVLKRYRFIYQFKLKSMRRKK